MLSLKNSNQALKKLFQKNTVADLSLLYKALDTGSRMSVFRRLQKIGYTSSYTHAGRYYTLVDTPDYDEGGLWFYGDIGYSEFGTLKNSILELIKNSQKGVTQNELQQKLRVRVQGALSDLFHKKLISREKNGGLFLYLHSEIERADDQIFRRRSSMGRLPSLPYQTIVEVLVEGIRGCHMTFSVEVIVDKLKNRGISVNHDQVKKLFKEYRIEISGSDSSIEK